jgi:hypothetical protein
MNNYLYSYPNNNQFLQNLLLQQSQSQQQSLEVIKVSGINGVNAFQMPPNSSALLLDTTAPIVWLVQTDGAGYKTSTAYDITPHENKEDDQYKTLEERISKLEGIINAKQSNVKNARGNNRTTDAE